MIVFKPTQNWQSKLADEIANLTIGRRAFVGGKLQGHDMTKLPRYPIHTTVIDGLVKEQYTYCDVINILNMGESSLVEAVDIARELIRSVPSDVVVKLTQAVDSAFTVTTKQMKVADLNVSVNIANRPALFGIAFDEFDLLTSAHGAIVDLMSNYDQFKLVKNTICPRLDGKMLYFEPRCAIPAIYILNQKPGRKRRLLQMDQYFECLPHTDANLSGRTNCDLCMSKLYDRYYACKTKTLCAYCGHTTRASIRDMQIVPATISITEYIESEFTGTLKEVLLASTESIVEVQFYPDTRKSVHMIGIDHRYILTNDLMNYLTNPASRHFPNTPIVQVE